MIDSFNKTAIITGLRGQDGIYLAELLVLKGYKVIGTSHLISGSYELPNIGVRIQIELLDICNLDNINDLIQKYLPQEIYNLAARSSSSQLFDYPLSTLEINGLSVVRFLESIVKYSPSTRFCQASSSEVFANTNETPQNENTSYRPINAYGVSKVLATNIVSSYRSKYNLFAATAILYNHESPLRSVEYISRKITYNVAMITLGLKKELILGSLENKRDWGFAPDYVNGMWVILQQDSPSDFIISTGKTHSIREFCEVAFSYAGLDYKKFVKIDTSLLRRNDSTELVGDSTKLRKLGWDNTVSFVKLVHMMVDFDINLLRYKSNYLKS